MNQELVKTNGQRTAIQLPTIEELRDDNSLAMREKDNNLNVLLNEAPAAAWVREHPFAKNVKYIPIARLEWLMTRIFLRWHVEVREVSLIANSIGVTVRLHYLNPVDGEWQWMDGVGAVAMQVDKDCGATDFSHIKANAVQIGLPAAKSYAFKDACENIGNIFGKDINRKDNIDYRLMLGQVLSTVTAEQAFEIEELLVKSNADRKTFFEIFGVDSVLEIQAKDFKNAQAQLTTKILNKKM